MAPASIEPILFSKLPALIDGEVLNLSKDEPITTLLLDSRKVTSTEGAVFFAIKGERHNGHHFLRELYEAGVKQFIIEDNVDLADYPGANIYRVDSSLHALQILARTHRLKYHIPVIGITGSNGKTIIKEWLYQILSRSEVIVKNPGSYNSQIGVPLSVWQMEHYHTMGIFEAGISKPGEMIKLADIIRPTIGIFTNIGPAHDEGFSSLDDKIQEKLRLFDNTDTLIYCKDHPLLDDYISQQKIPIFSWGRSPLADVVVRKVDEHYFIKYGEHDFHLKLPFEDRASIENCFHVVALMLHLGRSKEEIQSGINTLKSVPMRLELKEGINRCYIIDDTYNNDLGGLEISLQFLSHQNQRKKKTLILSDVLESGLNEHELVSKISELVTSTGVQRFIGIGPVLSRHSNSFKIESYFYGSTLEFLTAFDSNLLNDEVILIKGARVFGFERIATKLQRKVHGTVMEIDLGALVHNFNLIKSYLRRDTKVMVMVKAFAYGSGSNEIANLLQYHKADYLGVAYTDEGVELRKSNIALPIMVMNPSEESFDLLLNYDLQPEVYSFRILTALINYLDGKPCKIHIKLDTGMHRLGFESDEIDALMGILSRNRNIHVESIFSHLAGADEATHDVFSSYQAQLFADSAKRIVQTLGYKPLYHILNSPGILRLPQYQHDMVRLGIGLYGVDPTNSSHKLKPVATLKTIISQIKMIRKGDTVGYGRWGKADSDRKVATIAIGYADGFSRAFSRGVGKVLINGKLVPVIGNVCMDMTMIDITGVEAFEGDEVIIFGSGLPIQKVASWINTIPYEILTNTSERVKRVFTAESI